MKYGNRRGNQDDIGAKGEGSFAEFTDENGGGRGFITVTAAGANQ